MIYRLLRLILKVILKPVFRISAENLNEVPEEGPVIIASNHKSWLDPVAIGIVLKRRVYFMAKAELFSIPVFNLLIKSLGAFPVQRGKADISSLRSALKVLKEGKVLGIFVEGTRVKSPGIGELKPGVYAISRLSKATVVLCAIKGTRPLLIKKFPPVFNRIKLKFLKFTLDPGKFLEEEYLAEMKKQLERMYDELGN